MNMSDINHMRRKLFNIVGGGGHTQRGQHEYFGGGGVLQKVHTRMHACTHTHV